MHLLLAQRVLRSSRGRFPEVVPYWGYFWVAGDTPESYLATASLPTVGSFFTASRIRFVPGELRPNLANRHRQRKPCEMSRLGRIRS
jgi:hypothetical protein